uniref:Uncharacterized protein n=1 Tax=Anguilla anguilla TaxID=7936 RepID=A0A0E9S7R3_ANGAN
MTEIKIQILDHKPVWSVRSYIISKQCRLWFLDKLA